MARAYMPSGLTPNQEGFVQGIAQGLNQSDAYRQAYAVRPARKDKSIWEDASKLAKLPKVAARLAELRAELAKIAVWDAVRLVLAFESTARSATADGQYAAAVGAYREIGKLLALYPDERVQVQGDIEVRVTYVEAPRPGAVVEASGVRELGEG